MTPGHTLKGPLFHIGIYLVRKGSSVPLDLSAILQGFFVTTSKAPVTTSEAPVTTSEALVTTVILEKILSKESNESLLSRVSFSVHQEAIALT